MRGDDTVDRLLEASEVEDAQRDPRAFAPLYERNFDAVYGFVSRRVGSRAEAEDVLAVVFSKALANIRRFEWRGVPFAAWLMRIAANEIADRGSSRVDLAPPEDLDVARLDEDLARVDGWVTLSRLVRELPSAQRDVVVQRFVEQRSIREVAEALGRSEGAVKQLQLRALRARRAGLGDADV